MNRRRSQPAGRRGTVAILAGILLPFLLGMAALSIDMGYVIVVRGQLQNAADSAALAGASQLNQTQLPMMGAMARSSPTKSSATQAATAKAGQFAALNVAGNVSVTIPAAQGGDVVVGYQSTPGADPDPTSTLFPNAVMVTVRRDALANNPVPLFFAPVIGFPSWSGNATATATFDTSGGSALLPLTMTRADWQAMINGTTSMDNYTVNPSTGAVTAGPDGIKEQQLYPSGAQSPSNKGLLQFGVASHSNSIAAAQIVGGPTQAQILNQWPGSGSTPAGSPVLNNGTFQVGADPGWQSSNFGDLATVAASGEVRLIFINDGTNPGNGANGSYTIVGFAPVRVVISSQGGSKNGYAYVQPPLASDTSPVIKGNVWPEALKLTR